MDCKESSELINALQCFSERAKEMANVRVHKIANFELLVLKQNKENVSCSQSNDDSL